MTHWLFSRRLLLLLLIVGCGCHWLPAQNLRDPEFTAQALEGLDLLHNLDHDLASEYFKDLKSQYPEHPAPPQYLAHTIWLRELFRRHELKLDRFTAPGSFDKPSDTAMAASDRQLFFDNIAECQSLASKILKEVPGHKDARYFIGLSEGTLGAFAFTIDGNRGRAFKHGKKAYRQHKDLVTEDRQYHDAYMSIGLYEYIVSNLPWYIKWLATIMGYHGSEEQGLEYLSLAAQKGIYITTDASVLLMVLLVREERFEEALNLVTGLRQKHPRNYLLHLNRARILEYMDATDQAVQEYRRIVELVESETPNYQKLPLSSFYYELGEKLLKLRRHREALLHFQKAIAHSDTSDRQRAMSHLKAGQTHDIEGEPTEAIPHYEQVLRLEEFANSHDIARKALEKLARKIDQ